MTAATACVLLLFSCSSTWSGEAVRDRVEEVLDDFHLAAAQADGERYFGHFTERAVFIGTDAEERWSLSEFRAFAEPYFSKGQGWAYVATERNVELSADGALAWFDERLENEIYGEVRGSGVLERTGEAWKISQYVLSLPVPNGLAGELVEQVRKARLRLAVEARQHFVERDGRRLSMWSKAASSSELARDSTPPVVVVLLPSSSYSARTFWDLPLRQYSVMESLAADGFEVFAVDPGGAGSEDRALPDLLTCLHEVEELRGARQVVLVGSGFGAQLAASVAVSAPERVRGVVLCDFSWKLTVGESTHEDGLQEPDVAEALAAYVDQRLELKRDLPPLDPKRIRAPCLLLHGRAAFEHPDQARRDDGRQFYSLLSGPKRWIEIPGAGQAAHLDRPHRLFQQALSGWIQRLPD